MVVLQLDNGTFDTDTGDLCLKLSPQGKKGPAENPYLDYSLENGMSVNLARYPGRPWNVILNHGDQEIELAKVTSDFKITSGGKRKTRRKSRK